MKEIYTIGEIKDVLDKRGFKICSETHEVKNARDPFVCLDEDGYFIRLTIDKAKHRLNTKFSRYSVSNPHSIDNINICGERNGFESMCVDDSFDCNKPLKFKCACSREFETDYYSYISGKKTRCSKCTNSHSDYSYEEVKSNLIQRGFQLLTSKEEYRGITITPLICVDEYGYKYKVCFGEVMKGKHPEIFHHCNPFSLENVKTYLKLNNMPYDCISEEFVSCAKPLKFKCQRCGEIITKKWKDINVKNKAEGTQGRIPCPNCDYTFESTHASVLKQIFLHECPDTEVEEKSCVNPETQCVMPTDIVNHRLKIAIEIQSQWHDYEDKKKRDAFKKKFWVDKGYDFYDPDIRDYSILEMCQLFFDIDKLPDYLDYSLNKTLNLKLVQEMLNKGFSVVKIAKQLEVEPYRIYCAVYANKIEYPEDYRRGGFVSIIQYDKSGNELGVYPTITQAAIENGIKPKSLISAMSKTGKCSGYIWKRVE